MSRSIARWSCAIPLWSPAVNLGLYAPWQLELFFAQVLRVPKVYKPVNEAYNSRGPGSGRGKSGTQRRYRQATSPFPASSAQRKSKAFKGSPFGPFLNRPLGGLARGRDCAISIGRRKTAGAVAALVRRRAGR